jgi:hypothetical protein
MKNNKSLMTISKVIHPLSTKSNNNKCNNLIICKKSNTQRQIILKWILIPNLMTNITQYQKIIIVKINT